MPLNLSIFKIINSIGLLSNSFVSLTICLESIWLPGRNAVTPFKSTLIPPFTLLKGVPVTTALFVKLSCNSCHAFCLTAFSLDKLVSPFELSRFSMKTSVLSPTLISALCPGLENSFIGTRPSLFKPTSMVTISFSIETIVPEIILFSLIFVSLKAFDNKSSYSEFEILFVLLTILNFLY